MSKKKLSKKPGKKLVGVSFRPLFLSLFSVAMTYGFASWAIDSGSLWVYLFTIVSFYYTVDFGLKFGKQFTKDGKKRKTSKARRA